ncbi:dATP/dGTP diphosphohydrolase domain-containing protein [Bradyrhizobium liaoningense]|uniref:dATP/dGTP diphosphohydrolase domain-containing protein n=1 Tax=Bradyrhizobium liaoningense TaxID=43992 RepID=UPI001BA4D1DC|nr:dATP/dGTP diphosphohydrolase domain-containing protein [Bradyrhizobium liaoningense]
MDPASCYQRDKNPPAEAELAAGYPLRPAADDAPFVLQRDPGDEHREGYHSHDRAARERDATEQRHTFTIPPGHVAVTDAEGRSTGEVRLKPTWPQDEGEAPEYVDGKAYVYDAASQTFAEPAPKPEHDATTNAKPTNPKDTFGVLKASLSFVSLPVLMETAVAMAEGGFKYGAHNYRVRGVRASVYVDATFRHVSDFWEGMDIDEESGAQLSHVTKAIASLTVLRDSMIRGNWIDDRPPPSPKGWLKKISAEMVHLAEKFPQPVARYLANGKRGPGRILENGE